MGGEGGGTSGEGKVKVAKKKEQEKWRLGVSSFALAKVKELYMTLGECSP